MSTVVAGIDTWGRNCNTLRARHSPTCASVQCCDDALDDRSRIVEAALTTRFAWRFRFPEALGRDQLAWKVRCQADAATSGLLRLKSLGAAAAVDLAVPASSPLDWLAGPDLTVAQSASGRDTILLDAQRDSGAANVDLHAVHLALEELVGNLPSGVDGEGFAAVDVGQCDADRGLTAGLLGLLDDNHDVMQRCHLWPICGWAEDLLIASKYGMQAALSDYQVVHRLTWSPPPGLGATTLGLSVLAHADGGTDNVRIRSSVSGGRWLDSRVWTPAATAGTLDPSVDAQWEDFVLPAADDDAPTDVWVYVRGDGTHHAAIRSLCVWVEARA